VKPSLPQVTLICADCTPKALWSLRAIEKSQEQCDFGNVVFVRHLKIDGLGAYSKFCIREMHKYVDTSHALIVQYDGYVLNGAAWSDEFLSWDYIGAPFNPSGLVGNGGFSLRSKKLMQWIAQQNWDDFHPEDSCICVRHRDEIERAGFRIAPYEVASRFAFEGRSWDSREWAGTPKAWNGQFGFHSLLTNLPAEHRVCNIFTHSGDAGDVIYGMAVIKRYGGGMLFLTPDNRHPYPLNSRWARMGGEAAWVDNLAPLIEAQPYILKCRYTHGHPASTTHDLNRFRIPWRNRTAQDFDSILKLHCDAFGMPLPTDPWLTIADPIVTKPIVVNRTARYQDLNFNWTRFIERFHKEMVFVGDEMEYQLFRGFAPHCKFDYCVTSNALALARVIAGAEKFAGNQSFALAIAHALQKPVAVEEWPLNRNTRIDRPMAVYGFPEQWV
jgi:hypothetical protein